MTTLAIPAPQPNVGTITCAGLTRISSLLAGSMIWDKSTAKLVSAPPVVQAAAGLSSQTGSPSLSATTVSPYPGVGSVECGFFGLQPALNGLAAAHAVVQGRLRAAGSRQPVARYAHLCAWLQCRGGTGSPDRARPGGPSLAAARRTLGRSPAGPGQGPTSTGRCCPAQPLETPDTAAERAQAAPASQSQPGAAVALAHRDGRGAVPFSASSRRWISISSSRYR